MKLTNNASSTHNLPTLKSKKIAFAQIKKDLFPKLTKVDAVITHGSVSSKSTDLTVDKKPHITNESIKELIAYIFSDNKEKPSISCENNKSLTDVRPYIDVLKKHRFSDKTYYTKSIIDVAITLYIAYIINNKKTNDADGLGYSGLKSAFINGLFKDDFIKFLSTTCTISKEAINKIKPEYIKHIKLFKANTYIKLNNYILDTNSVAADDMQCRISGPLVKVKNSTISDHLSNEEIQDLKKEARDYFEEIVKYIKGKYTATPEDKQKKQDLILKIIHFNKMLNVFSRKFSDGEFNYSDYIEIADKAGIFKGLEIESQHDKLEFINHSIMLNYKRNKGMTVKRIFFKAPLLALHLATVFSGVIIGLMYTLPVVTAIGGVVGITMLTFYAVGTLEGLYYSVNASRQLAQTINCGDRYNTYTNSATEIFIKLTQEYNNCEEKINGKPINMTNYKKTECWGHTIMSSAIEKSKNTGGHIVAMNNMRQYTRKNNRNKFPRYADELTN